MSESKRNIGGIIAVSVLGLPWLAIGGFMTYSAFTSEYQNVEILEVIEKPKIENSIHSDRALYEAKYKVRDVNNDEIYTINFSEKERKRMPEIGDSIKIYNTGEDNYEKYTPMLYFLMSLIPLSIGLLFMRMAFHM